jgi:hypothetical protein
MAAATSTRTPEPPACPWQSVFRFVVCLSNEGYPASLEPRKLYRALRDPEGEAVGRVRVIDESGEDYLYPRDYFLPVPLPAAVEEALEQTLTRDD